MEIISKTIYSTEKQFVITIVHESEQYVFLVQTLELYFGDGIIVKEVTRFNAINDCKKMLKKSVFKQMIKEIQQNFKK
jgi:hypothetical protein